jgi:hypothetical protein
MIRGGMPLTYSQTLNGLLLLLKLYQILDILMYLLISQHLWPNLMVYKFLYHLRRLKIREESKRLFSKASAFWRQRLFFVHVLYIWLNIIKFSTQGFGRWVQKIFIKKLLLMDIALVRMRSIYIFKVLCSDKLMQG